MSRVGVRVFSQISKAVTLSNDPFSIGSLKTVSSHTLSTSQTPKILTPSDERLVDLACSSDQFGVQCLHILIACCRRARSKSGLESGNPVETPNTQ